MFISTSSQPRNPEPEKPAIKPENPDIEDVPYEKPDEGQPLPDDGGDGPKTC